MNLNWKQRGRSDSLWTLVTGPLNIESNLKKVNDEVVALKKSAVNSRAAILELPTISTVKQPDRSGAEGQVQSSLHWRVGEQLIAGARDLHQSSDLREVTQKIGEMEKSLALVQAQYENRLTSDLGPESAIYSLMMKDYPNMQKEKENLRKKQKELENVKARFNKERVRNKNLEEDQSYAKPRIIREAKLSEDLDSVTKDCGNSEDKLATILYTIQAKEGDYAKNLVQTVSTLQAYLTNMLAHIEETLPRLEKIANRSHRIFGEALSDHLRWSNVRIAIPISFSIKLLWNHVQSEGLFRISASVHCLKRIKAGLDAGLAKQMEASALDDPHLLTGILKSYLRELPVPLLTFSLADEWRFCSQIVQTSKRRETIRNSLAKLPRENYDNLKFLFEFLSYLSQFQEINKMSSENLSIVIGPNLLWEQDGSPVLIDRVYTTMIDDFVNVFEKDRNIQETEACYITSRLQTLQLENIEKRSSSVKREIKTRRTRNIPIFETEPKALISRHSFDQSDIQPIGDDTNQKGSVSSSLLETFTRTDSRILVTPTRRFSLK